MIAVAVVVEPVAVAVVPVAVVKLFCNWATSLKNLKKLEIM